jgi:hypothetical protein
MKSLYSTRSSETPYLSIHIPHSETVENITKITNIRSYMPPTDDADANWLLNSRINESLKALYGLNVHAP